MVNFTPNFAGMRIRVLLLILLLAGLSLLGLGHREASGQIQARRAVQFSGLVVTGDNLEPVPLVNIWVKNTHRGAVTDFFGFFSIVVQLKDTLRFTSIGFDSVYYVVPDTLTESRYSVIQILTRDTIYLPETVVYPWPTREQFRHAFLHTKIPDDDYDRAMRNLARAEMRERLQNMPMDGAANFRHAMNQHAQRLYYAGQTPPVRLFDPFAWAQFIRAWREGRFRRSD